jgi:hypothetical protein
MTDPAFILILALAALSALAMGLATALRGWREWLALKRLELQQQPATATTAGSRIELADLKERIRKLEAIAAGVDI